jgi:hypothetical protein
MKKSIKETRSFSPPTVIQYPNGNGRPEKQTYEFGRRRGFLKRAVFFRVLLLQSNYENTDNKKSGSRHGRIYFGGLHYEQGIAPPHSNLPKISQWFRQDRKNPKRSPRWEKTFISCSVSNRSDFAFPAL